MTQSHRVINYLVYSFPAMDDLSLLAPAVSNVAIAEPQLLIYHPYKVLKAVYDSSMDHRIIKLWPVPRLSAIVIC